MTDTIELENLVQDPVYGEKVGTSKVVECRVEAVNKLITNHQGQDIRTHTFIMMSHDEVIQTGDRFKILTVRGVPYRNPDKQFQVAAVFDNGEFGVGNLEVYS